MDRSDAFKALLLEIATERSLADLLELIVRRVAAMDSVAMCRIWLIEPGDICHTCHFRSECRDQTRCLHLVASAGQSTVDPSLQWRQLDGRFQRFPIGIRKIGHVAATGEAVNIRDTRRDMKWVAVPEWVQAEAIQSLTSQPVIFRGEIMGVFAVFSRKTVVEDDLIWHRMLADHAAAAIAHARAFEEIERLQRRLELENEYLREEVETEGAFGEILGTSPTLRDTTRQIAVVAATDANVLITGESGTGKELVAREIHRHSNRKHHPLIRVNCAAIPHDLYESEFFGHVRGAFSGAVRDRAGRFEAADGGTLFLDEIGEIPLSLQVKLLRTLQEGTFERVGDTKTRRVDVRIIAATNRDLQQEVDEGRFRQDLFYRLNVFPIAVAPLRQRTEDIGILAKSFMEQTCQRLNRPPLRLTQGTLASLRQYDWPGNVRELQNLIERAVITSTGRSLRIDLPSNKKTDEATPSSKAPETTAVLTEAELRKLERDNVLRALAQTDGKVSGPDGAAALLGMKSSTLSSRIKAMKIRWIAQ